MRYSDSTTTEDIHELYARIEQARITPEIAARHRQTVERIQAKLFRKYPVRDYFILPESLEILPPHVPTHPHLSPALGGVCYDVESLRVGSRIELSVKHWSDSRFVIFMTIHTESSGASYTRFAVETDFRELDERVLDCVLAYRREERPIPPLVV